jgi:hypothetical protein
VVVVLVGDAAKLGVTFAVPPPPEHATRVITLMIVIARGWGLLTVLINTVVSGVRVTPSRSSQAVSNAAPDVSLQDHNM